MIRTMAEATTTMKTGRAHRGKGLHPEGPLCSCCLPEKLLNSSADRLRLAAVLSEPEKALSLTMTKADVHRYYRRERERDFIYPDLSLVFQRDLQATTTLDGQFGLLYSELLLKRDIDASPGLWLFLFPAAVYFLLRTFIGFSSEIVLTFLQIRSLR